MNGETEMHSLLRNDAKRNHAIQIEAEARALWCATYAAAIVKFLVDADRNPHLDPHAEAMGHADRVEESYLTVYLTDAALAFRRDNGSIGRAWASRGVEE